MAGMGVAQVFELGIEALLKRGKPVNLFPDWSDEHFPLYIYYTSPISCQLKCAHFLTFLGRWWGNRNNGRNGSPFVIA